MEQTQVLAIDFGASSGRAIIAKYFHNENMMELKEIHRFPNEPVMVNGTLYWDVLRLFHEIKCSLVKSKQYGEIESIAIDTWGVDFGLLGKDGKLLGNPVHYRDIRTQGMLEKSFKCIEREDFYSHTGNQFLEINTAFQLYAMREITPEVLEQADCLLMMPDLFHYFLSGEKTAELSIASTTQLFDPVKRSWSEKILEALNLNPRLFPELVESGTVIGQLSSEICEELGVEPMKVIAVAGHDTQSAIAAVPACEDDFIFISCGTWSLLGTELPAPIINKNSLELNITNEQGIGGKTTFLKNITGLWLIQESRRQWIKDGVSCSFEDMTVMAEAAKPFQCFIDPDAPIFAQPGDIPDRIRQYCRQTEQYIPVTKGEIVRCINESLALKYRLTVEEIKTCTGKEYNTIYIIGGGARSEMLCRMTANASHCIVTAGPVEATALGNGAVQLMTLGQLKDLQELREAVRRSSDIKLYRNEDDSDWDEAYERFLKVIHR
jgi:rhamnulokinase/L-fuculokinase